MAKLEELGLNDEQLKAINSVLDKHTKTIEALKEDKKMLETQITERDNLITEFEKNKTDIDSLNKQIEDYKALEQNYKDQLADRDLNDKVNSHLGKYNFVNDITKRGLFNDLKNALKDQNNTGKSTEEIYNELTKELNDIYKPEEDNSPKVVIPPTNNTELSDSLEISLAKAMGLNP